MLCDLAERRLTTPNGALMHRPTVLATCGVFATVLLAGCGSSTSTSATSAPASTTAKAAYITQADAICADGNTQVTAIGAAPGDPTAATADQLPAWSAYIGKVNTILSTEAPKLAALPNPDQGQAQSDAVLGDLAKVITDGAAAEFGSPVRRPGRLQHSGRDPRDRFRYSKHRGDRVRAHRLRQVAPAAVPSTASISPTGR